MFGKFWRQSFALGSSGMSAVATFFVSGRSWRFALTFLPFGCSLSAIGSGRLLSTVPSRSSGWLVGGHGHQRSLVASYFVGSGTARPHLAKCWIAARRVASSSNAFKSGLLSSRSVRLMR